jgi:hypothetical protein
MPATASRIDCAVEAALSIIRLSASTIRMLLSRLLDPL